MKRWKSMMMTGTVILSLLTQPLAVLASDTTTRNGSFHIDQFGEYDILAEVDVKDGYISKVEISGANFGGTYANVNKEKLTTAATSIIKKMKGISATDAKKITDVDGVSGATISSNGIKKAVLNALDLKEETESTGRLESVPEAGNYQVKVSVRSDVVDHSLVETDTAVAQLTVDEAGKMQISYKMISGTEKEPMYILDFNGYYMGNDRTGNLTKECVSAKKEGKGEYSVVTDVTFPLCDISGTYYANSTIYVPAMSNLNGPVAGVIFENGKFSVDNIITVYWNTLKNAQTASDSEKNMEITATIEETLDTPNYSVVIPAAVSMGNVSKKSDSEQPYKITVNTADKKGAITVTAPEEGELKNGKKVLKFTNDFGKQTILLGNSQKARSASGNQLSGVIKISAEDVRKVPAGSYSGTTVFTIAYDENKIDTPNTDQDQKPNPNPTPNKDQDQKPNPMPDTDETPNVTPDLDVKNLADGVYSVTGKMVKVDKKTASMADKAINHTIMLTVKNGKYYITFDFNGIDIGGKFGYMGALSYYLDGYSQNSYGAIQGTVEKGTIESYQENEDGSRVSDTYGTDYPKKITLPLITQALTDGFVPLQVDVPIMGAIAGSSSQQMFLALDWSTIAKTTEGDPVFDKDDSDIGNSNGNDTGNNSVLNSGGNLSGGSSLSGGSNLSGGSSLSGGSLTGSSLTSGSGLKGSSLSGTSMIKTGDTEAVSGWIALMIGCGLIIFVVIADKKKREYLKKTKK